MANAYYEYAVSHHISKKYIAHNSRYTKKKIQVYSYFELPLSIMTEEYHNLLQIRRSYEWLDFDYTVIKYRSFLL